MDGYSRMDEEVCPQLLDLISKDRDLLVQRRSNHEGGASSEEKKLELRLGPPGVEDYWTINHEEGSKNKSLLSFGNLSNLNHNRTWIVNNNGSCNSHKFSSSSEKTNVSFLQLQSSTPQSSSTVVMGKESSPPCCTTMAADLQKSAADKKPFSSPASAKIAVPNGNNSQKRSAPAPVVGWPPIRSFRKNLASSSSSAKQAAPEHQNVVVVPPDKVVVAREKPVESCGKGLFVKINMDGVPIGRKVDLKAYDSYEKLSSSVDELFRGLLAAQRDFSAPGLKTNQQEEKGITGLLDGSGEYTLVYEDNEGDRMLVGDVPWHMFVSTVKRLRVLKSSELSTLCLGSKQEKIRS